MIKAFKHKGLAEIWERGRSAKIRSDLHKKALRLLDALDRATKPEDMNVPGFDFHKLTNKVPPRWTCHINGPWCITFEFDEGHAVRLDYEQYH